MTPTFRAGIRVALKKGVTDPEGKSTHKALELLGFRDVRGVAAERLYAVELAARSEEDARRQGDEIARRLLANPVIHEYTITVEKVR
ncbi:MAG TPA: phosphoribosylformylglycinamidine synthase subunit PurS [Candidatus Thermoplasmatota archaeon]|nr:phosphoribosylformylglycinamidine synthase subunit PurS [Candidatus Thermoplasmatota archaeon]